MHQPWAVGWLAGWFDGWLISNTTNFSTGPISLLVMGAALSKIGNAKKIQKHMHYVGLFWMQAHLYRELTATCIGAKQDEKAPLFGRFSLLDNPMSFDRA